MTGGFEIHSGQYIVGVPRPGLESWQTTAAAGVDVHHSPHLPVARSTSGRTAILGWAFQNSGAGPVDATTLDAFEAVGSLEPLLEWSGRWSLLHDGGLFADATASHGPYFVSGPQGVAISASPALLLATGLTGASSPMDLFKSTFNWYPTPQSRFDNVSRLLHDQRLDLHTGTVVAVPELLLSASDNRGTRDRADLLMRCLRGVVASTALAGHRLHLPLTGGMDSRTLLAAAHAEGVPVETFTFLYPGIDQVDVDRPPRLAASMGYPHEFVPYPGRVTLGYGEVDAHTGSSSHDSDREFVARGMWDRYGPSDLFLRGGGFEVGRGMYDPRFAGLSLRDWSDDPALLARRFARLPATATELGRLLTDWVTARRGADFAIDWTDLFYLEQRVGTWFGGIEQLLDSTRTHRIHAVNSRTAYGALVRRQDEADRPDIQERLIRDACPELLAYPLTGTASARWARARHLARSVARQARAEVGIRAASRRGTDRVS